MDNTYNRYSVVLDLVATLLYVLVIVSAPCGTPLPFTYGIMTGSREDSRELTTWLGSENNGVHHIW
jgi:hypothetical protein